MICAIDPRGAQWNGEGIGQVLEQHDATVSNRPDAALTQLRRMLSEGQLETDGRLPPERDLAASLGVGRRSLRRALGVLEQEGRITRRQGQGTFVRRVQPAIDLRLSQVSEHTNPLEVMEVRLALEPALARMAAVRASRHDIDRLAVLAAATRLTKTPSAYERANTAFHRHIATAARNALYLAMFDALSEILRDLACERLTESGHCFNRQGVYADFHDQVVAAITARDGDRAEKLMYAHLRDVQQNILARVYPVSEQATPEPAN